MKSSNGWMELWWMKILSSFSWTKKTGTVGMCPEIASDLEESIMTIPTLYHFSVPYVGHSFASNVSIKYMTMLYPCL